MAHVSSLTSRFSLLSLSAAGLLFLSGCGMPSTFSGPADTSGSAIQGTVFGGQQAIGGAKVYLLAVGITGFGSPVTSVLGSAANTAADTATLSGTTLYYTTTATDGSGSFSITGDYTCSPGQLVFLYATGGNPMGGDPSVQSNPAIGLMAGLGACPAAGNFAGTNPFIVINEVTTVAMAYSLAGYAADALHIGAPGYADSTSGTAYQRTAEYGLPNAMANIANIVDISHGTALAAPSNAPTGSVPVSKINALADILASCINGASGNANCGTLFSNITSNGNPASGTPPMDTATAAIYMAKNQWHAPAAIFALISPISPFPTSILLANDLSLPITYSSPDANGGTGLEADTYGSVWESCNGCGSMVQYSPQGASNPVPTTVAQQGLAVDRTGNVWITQPSANTLAVYDPTGKTIAAGVGLLGDKVTTTLSPWSSPYNPTTNGTQALSSPLGLSFDSTNEAFVANSTAGTVVELTSVGTYRATVSTTTPNAVMTAVAKNGDLWVGSSNPSAPLYYLPQAGSPFPAMGSQTQTTITIPNCTSSAQFGSGLATDGSSNAWFSCGNGVAMITPAGAATTYTGPLHAGGGIAIDSAGNVFQGGGSAGSSLNEFNASGTLLTTAAGYTLPSANNQQVSIDASGNVWVTGTSAVYQELGMAAPTALIGPANVWARPLHMVYALAGGPALQTSDGDIITNLDMVAGGVTAATPFFLNVTTPSNYTNIMGLMQANATIFTPGIGGPATTGSTQNQINIPGNRSIVDAYVGLTKWIRLENTQGFFNNNGGFDDINGLINYIVSKGFTHIMLNPWPVMSVNGQQIAAAFTQPELEADFVQASSRTFAPSNLNVVAANRAYRPSLNFVNEYESPGPQGQLLALPVAQQQIDLNITCTAVEQGPIDTSFALPITKSYNPFLIAAPQPYGTQWVWMADRLGLFQ